MARTSLLMSRLDFRNVINYSIFKMDDEADKDINFFCDFVYQTSNLVNCGLKINNLII